MGDEERKGESKEGVEAEIEQQMNLVEVSRRKLNRLLSSFTARNISAATLDVAEERLKEIRDLHLNVGERVDDLRGDYVNELTKKMHEEFEEMFVKQTDLVNQHELEVRDKILQLKPPAPPLTAYEAESLKIQMKMLELEVERKKDVEKEKDGKVIAKAGGFRGRSGPCRDTSSWWRSGRTVSIGHKQMMT